MGSSVLTLRISEVGKKTSSSEKTLPRLIKPIADGDQSSKKHRVANCAIAKFRLIPNVLLHGMPRLYECRPLRRKSGPHSVRPALPAAILRAV